MQNFERIDAVIIRRFERRLAECRHYRRSQKRLGLDWLFRGGAEGGGLAGDGRRREHQCGQNEQECYAATAHRVTKAS